VGGDKENKKQHDSKLTKMKEYTSGQDLSSYRHLLLGDISGIQEFIFNVKSEGAAKTLKGRSFFVHAVAELAIDVLDEFMADNCLLFYNGGGNFYVFCNKIDETNLAEMKKAIQRELADVELYLTICHTPLLDDFSKTWKNIHQVANQEKLHKFSQFFGAFNPAKRIESEGWKAFAKKLTRSKGSHIDAHPSKQKVLADGIGLFGKILQLDNKNTGFEHTALNKLPEWTPQLLQLHAEYAEKLFQRNLKNDPNADKATSGDIIEFETMGHFAHLRTGTDKIGVLKMDVDNLGSRFLSTKDPAAAKHISDALKDFFGSQLLDLWKGAFGTPEAPVHFRENIYIVFAGGDDCMIIGAWDAVFEFAKRIRDAFSAMAQTQGYPDMTLSASLILLDSKFPVVRMSDLAEEAIKTAKKENPAEKNRISVFGNVLTWDEFGKAHETAHCLAALIRDNEPRGILNRLQVSHIGYEKLQERAIANGTVHNPAIWRLFYFIRNAKNLADIHRIVEVYQKALLDAVISKKRFNAAAMTPVAARWAEFLTRKKD
jgi:CRISPR-associated protein Csm1